MKPVTDVGSVRFGRQRRVRPDVSRGARLLYRAIGIADPAHWLHARYCRESLRRFMNHRPLRILDAGCGDGDFSFYLAQLFPDAEVLGIDVDERSVERSRATSRLMGLDNVRFELADLAEVDRANTFDLVVCVDVLEHITRQAEAIRSLYLSMAPGGVAFIHMPTVRPVPVPFSKRLGAFHKWAEDEHVAEELTAEQFQERMLGAGFEILELRRTFGRYTGELATSLFALFFEDRPLNRVAQGLMSPVCRLFALADVFDLDTTRYAVAVTARKPV